MDQIATNGESLQNPKDFQGIAQTLFDEDPEDKDGLEWLLGEFEKMAAGAYGKLRALDYPDWADDDFVQLAEALRKLLKEITTQHQPPSLA